MSLTANSVSSYGELAKIIIKAENGMVSLTSDEKLRFHFWMLVAVRRFEAIYIQALYGSIEKDRIKGFETSILSLLSNVNAAPNIPSTWSCPITTVSKPVAPVILKSLISPPVVILFSVAAGPAAINLDK